MKRRHTIVLAIMISVIFVWSGIYYYNTSVHKHISMTDVLDIQTFGSNQGFKGITDREQERIVKGFNSIKSIRRQNKNSLPVAKIGRAIIIKLNTGSTIEIYWGYAVGWGLMIETPGTLYIGRNTELEDLLKSLQ